MKNNRLGQSTEDLVNQACEVYSIEKRANIYKIPTPFKIIGKKDKYLLAVPSQKSTVDYMGEYMGIPFAMEVKESINKTRYPLDPWNREAHQREFLARWNGCRYYLISFLTLGEFYLLNYEQYEDWYVKSMLGGRKSIPIDWFRHNAMNIPFKKGILDFLYAIDKSSTNKQNKTS